MAASSNLVLLISLATTCIYGYSAYFMNFDANLAKMHHLIPAELKPYGQLKFLTYQCLLIQLISSILHVGAHFLRSLERPRDIVFTSLAYPVGSIVVYSFWAVWHLAGRELIFPKELSAFYPDWLNHATHSIIAPLNIILAVLLQHKPSRKGAFITITYFALYICLLLFIKAQSGLFVYKYLEAMNNLQLVVYFACTGFASLAFYKTGNLLANLVHGDRTKSTGQRQPAAANQKSKQKQR